MGEVLNEQNWQACGYYTLRADANRSDRHRDNPQRAVALEAVSLYGIPVRELHHGQSKKRSTVGRIDTCNLILR